MPRRRLRGRLPTKGRRSSLLLSKQQQQQHNKFRPSCFVNLFIGVLLTLLLVMLLAKRTLDSSTFQSSMVASLSSEVDTLRSYSSTADNTNHHHYPHLSENKRNLSEKPPPKPTKTSSSSLPFPVPIPRDMHIDKILPRLLPLFPKNSSTSTRKLVNLGAGVRDDDPTYLLLDDPTKNGPWEAFLVDGDERQGRLMAERFPNSDKIQTKVAYITANTVSDLLSQHGFLIQDDLDLLKIDIDSFDCFVVDTLLKVVRPSVIIMEVNVKFPPNVRFAFLPGFPKKDETSDSPTKSEQYPFDSEQRGHVYGCSLAYQVYDLMRPHGYEILYLDTNNAIYYDKRREDVLPPGLKDYTPLSLTKLYHRGYWNIPDRTTRFAFNNELESWQEYNADQIFSYLQKNHHQASLVSHGHHQVVMGDLVHDGNGPQPPLRKGCFDPNTGILNEC